MNGLQAAIASLVRRVAALEARASGGETRSPNYLTITPGGLVGANFTGLINALGLVIPEAPSNPQVNKNSIIWTDATNTVREWIQGSDGLTEHTLELSSQSDANDYGRVRCISFVSGGAGSAGVVAEAGDTVSGTLVNVIISNGGSDFVQSNNKQASATAGAATLPANPVGFLQFKDQAGSSFKVPYYNV